MYRNEQKENLSKMLQRSVMKEIVRAVVGKLHKANRSVPSQLPERSQSVFCCFYSFIIINTEPMTIMEN